MGVVYYANYLVLFERGRTEYLPLHVLGLPLPGPRRKTADLHAGDGDRMSKYFAPARDDDMIEECAPSSPNLATRIRPSVIRV